MEGNTLLVEVRLTDEEISARGGGGQAIGPLRVARKGDDSPVELDAESVSRCAGSMKNLEGGYPNQTHQGADSLGELLKMHVEVKSGI